jgi:two-component system sporulation sensor kinase B
MDLLTKDLLVNFLFILLPLFLVQILYQLNFAYRFKKLKEWMFAIFPVVSLILCMAFPVAVSEDFSWDLRRIPVILGALYGGYKLGFFLLVLIIVLRYPMGGDGFYVALYTHSIMSILIAFLSAYYLKMALKKKLLVSVSLTVLSIMISFISLEMFSLQMNVDFWISYTVINVFAISITTALLETIRANVNVLQKLMKAEKLEVVSHLAASISHEVRNPLTVSRGFIQLSNDEEVPSVVRKEYLNTAIKELDRAAEIINDYLMFAKPALEKEEKIRIYEEVQHVVNVMMPLAKMNGVQLHLSLSDDEKCFALGERKKLEQCLINILKNGIESMPDGGNLHISIGYQSHSIHITIRDEGTGMTQEQLNRLGEPYFTTKTQGTGLGMMVSFSIIQSMKGKINVTSEQGKGTCFHIKLPSE